MFGESRLKEGEFHCPCGWKEYDGSKPIWPEVNGEKKRFAWVCPDCHQIYGADYAMSEGEHNIMDDLLKELNKERSDEIDALAWKIDESDGCRRLFREAVREEKRLEGDKLNFKQKIKYLRSKGWTWSKIQKVCPPVEEGTFVVGL